MSSNINLCVPRMITVPQEEWDRLKQLETELPTMLEKAKEEERKDALERLHQRDKENPEAARKRALKRYTTNKEEIKAKRREAYRLKKEAKQAANSPGVCSSGEEKTPAHQ